jgi:hypothetical protein
MFGRSLARTTCPHPGAPPSNGWRMNSAEQCDPFAPAPLQSLPHYYGSLRPCAPRRYSGPCGFSHLDVSLGIGTTGSHVPYKSLMRARAVFTPDAVRSEIKPSLELVPGEWEAPGFDVIFPFSTLQQRFACARLPASHLPRSSSRISATLTTNALYASSLQRFEACA